MAGMQGGADNCREVPLFTITLDRLQKQSYDSNYETY